MSVNPKHYLLGWYLIEEAFEDICCEDKDLTHALDHTERAAEIFDGLIAKASSGKLRTDLKAIADETNRLAAFFRKINAGNVTVDFLQNQYLAPGADLQDAFERLLDALDATAELVDPSVLAPSQRGAERR